MRNGYIQDDLLIISERKKYYFEGIGSVDSYYIGNYHIKANIIINVHDVAVIEGVRYLIRLHTSYNGVDLEDQIGFWEINDSVILPELEQGTLYIPDKGRYSYPIDTKINDVIYPYIVITNSISQATLPDIAMIEYSTYLSI